MCKLCFCFCSFLQESWLCKKWEGISGRVKVFFSWRHDSILGPTFSPGFYKHKCKQINVKECTRHLVFWSVSTSLLLEPISEISVRIRERAEDCLGLRHLGSDRPFKLKVDEALKAAFTAFSNSLSIFLAKCLASYLILSRAREEGTNLFW